jgi:hypothetical protein
MLIVSQAIAFAILLTMGNAEWHARREATAHLFE